jgi:hypothetical protein
MNYTTCRSTIHTIKQGDKNFLIYDGLTVAPRAGFEIADNCPKDYLCIIQMCYEKGWLKPIANISERELLFAGLANE